MNFRDLNLPAMTALVALAVVPSIALAPHGGIDAAATTLVRIAFWGLLLVASAALAARVTGSPLRGAAHLVWDGATGIGLLAALVILVGQLPGAFQPWPLALLLAIVVLAGVIVRLRGDEPREPSIRAGSWPMPAWIVLAIVLGVGLVWDRVPPVFYDSLDYHFAQPALWLVEARVAPAIWSLHSWFPPGMSALYGLGLAFGGDTLANDANLLVALLFLGLATELAQRLWGALEATLSLLLLLTLPITLNAIGIPAADLGRGMFGFASLACWLIARGDSGASWPRRASLLAGAALLCKYLGLLVPVALGAVLFAIWPPAGADSSTPRGGVGAALRRAVTFVVPALLLSVPWFAANWWTTGNPVAPALHSLVAVEGLAPGGTEAFEIAARGGYPSVDDLFALYRGFIDTSPAEARTFYPVPIWGWTPLLLLPGLVLASRRDRALQALLGLIAVGFTVWLCTYRWERFLVGTSGLLSVALAAAAVASWRRGGPLRLLPPLAVAVSLLTLVRTGQGVLTFTGGAGVALGRESPAAFLARSFPTEVVYQAANRLLRRSTDRVLVIGETRHHHLTIPHTAPTVYNRHPLVDVAASSTSAAAITHGLRAAGYTHLIVDRAGTNQSVAAWPSLRGLRGQELVLTPFFANLGRPLFAHAGVELYALTTDHDAAGDRPFHPNVVPTALDGWRPPWSAAATPPAGTPADPLRRWMVFCWDGADWDLVLPMIEAGLLPNLAELMRGGSYGNLYTIEPTFSPTVWTTIATGRSPAAHGILGFMNEATGQLYSNSDRRTRAIWDLLSEQHRKSLVVGYHNTFPVDAIDGVMVSNYLTQSHFNDLYGVPAQTPLAATSAQVGLVHPATELERVRAIEAAVHRAMPAAIGRFVDLRDPNLLAEILAERSAHDEGAYWKDGLKRGYLYDTIHATVAAAEYPLVHPDLLLLHFQSVDWAAHRFLYFHQPELYAGVGWPDGVRAFLESSQPTYGHTLTAFYQYVDEWTGKLLELREPGTGVIVLSDHGFELGTEPVRTGEHFAAPPGILVMHGPGIRGDARIEGATVYDILPTLLASLQLPLSRELEGKVLAAAFEPSVRERLRTTTVDTYETVARDPPRVELPDDVTDEIKDQLRSLGYIP